MTSVQIDIPPRTILGHPLALFVLFFTEMWERFSYYGMRTLLVLFLVSGAHKGGWGWSRADATELYAWYSMSVYLTPLIGGYVADRLLGTRRAVVIGAFIIAAGHVSLFFDSPACFYLGLVLVALGTGFFKPNISAIVGQLYGKGNENARDGGYTIFYMGVNAGAFFGISLCGYIGEKISWHLGFGLAAVFMMLGALQFWLSAGVFGSIGGTPTSQQPAAQQEDDSPPAKVVRDRLIVVGILSFFTIFFWIAFDQGGGSMTIFAADYTHRHLDGATGMAFKVFNALITLIPVGILSWLLVQLTLALQGRHRSATALLVVALSMIWGLSLWMLAREFSTTETVVPATWFGVLNSFFIVVFAPLFSRLWERHWNPPGPAKFALGLVSLGVAFLVLAYGARDIAPGARTAEVCMAYMVAAKLLLTIGELCLSPVGLSYISKLAPTRFFGLMFGIWFLNAAVAARIAGLLGSRIDEISTAYSMSTFFLMFSVIPIGAGLLLLCLQPVLSRLMHGVR